PVRLVPVVTRELPRAVALLVEATVVIVAACLKVKRVAAVSAEVPPAVVTLTSTVPAACAGAVAVICVGVSTVKPVAFVAPNLTGSEERRVVKERTTEVPPAAAPMVGANPGRFRASMTLWIAA